MALEKTLRKVEYDLSLGRCEKARDRLNGLINSYPSDLTLRRKLGDIHYQLGNIREAGRYWYLEEHKTPEMVAACDRFEKACGRNPVQIGRRLKFRGNIDTVRETNPYAVDVLLALHKRAKEEYGYTLYYSAEPVAIPSLLAKCVLAGIRILALIPFLILVIPVLLPIFLVLYLREFLLNRKHRQDKA